MANPPKINQYLNIAIHLEESFIEDSRRCLANEYLSWVVIYKGLLLYQSHRQWIGLPKDKVFAISIKHVRRGYDAWSIFIRKTFFFSERSAMRRKRRIGGVQHKVDLHLNINVIYTWMYTFMCRYIVYTYGCYQILYSVRKYNISLCMYSIGLII